MILLLRGFFLVVLVTMIGVTGWASSEVALWDTPRTIAMHPWFLATLADAYWGFLTFYLWVAYKERSWLGRIGWLVAILLLGNIAMAVYALIQLFKVPADGKVEDVLLRRA